MSEATVVALLAGELSPAERARADAHVDRCPSCLGLVAALGRAEHEDAPERPSSERYVIREEIGAGGMGQVFEAFDAVLRRWVALKCVRSGPEDESAALRFEREMALTARLQHPSIIPVYDAGLFPDGSRYFAMRLVEGDTLDKAIASARTSTQRLALVPGIRRACEAVAYAHENAIVHRDLKPSNILIGPFGETVVLDWGLAKALEDDEVDGDSVLTTLADSDGMTRPGAVMGTVGYIAPEVAQGEAAGPRSDVFSLGSVLAKLLPPRDGDRTEADNDLAAIVSRATAAAAHTPTRSARCGEEHAWRPLEASSRPPSWICACAASIAPQSSSRLLSMFSREPTPPCSPTPRISSARSRRWSAAPTLMRCALDEQCPPKPRPRPSKLLRPHLREAVPSDAPRVTPK